VDNVRVNTADVRHGIDSSQVAVAYTFYRTYIQFDISGVTEPITSMRLYIYSDSPTLGQTTYVAYAGSRKGLNSTAVDYPLYLTEGAGRAELATISTIEKEYVSCNLNFAEYPIFGDDPTTPQYQNYNIALVADDDFLNNIDGSFGSIMVNNDDYPPYIVINGGYVNNVIGIPGANIATVSGVPSADITNIMGV
jgi:hypothetical protein